MVERIRTLLETRQLTPTQFADLIGVARPIVSHVLSGRNKPSLEVVQRILAAMPELAMPWLLNGSGPMLAPVATPNAAAVPGIMGTVAPVPVPAPASAPIEPIMSVPVPVSSGTPASEVPMVPGVARPGDVFPLAEISDSQLNMLDMRSGAIQAAPVGNLVGKPQANAVEPAIRAGKPLPFKTSQNKPAAKPKRFVAAPISRRDSGINARGNTTQNERVVPPAAPTPSPVVATPDLAVAPEPVAPHPPVQPVFAADSTSAASVAPESGMAQALFAGAEKPIRRIVIFYRDGSFADYQPE